MKDESYPAVYAYILPCIPRLSRRERPRPNNQDRQVRARLGSARCLTAATDGQPRETCDPSCLGAAAPVTQLRPNPSCTAVLDAFDRRHAGAASGSEVFRVSLATLDALAAAFGWVDSPDAARRSGAPGAEGPSKDAWRTGRNKAVKRWGFTYPQCARAKCGRPIDDTSLRGSDGRFRYCSSSCADSTTAPEAYAPRLMTVPTATDHFANGARCPC